MRNENPANEGLCIYWSASRGSQGFQMCSSLLADMQIDWNWQIIEFVADKSCFGHGDPPLNTHSCEFPIQLY